MDRVANFIQPLSEWANQHVPTEAIPPWWFAAAAALFFGVCVCVLGAKLAKWFIAVSFTVAGIAAGVAASRYTSVGPGLAALVGGLLIGGVGYGLHRIWVGLFAGVFLSAVALSLYSSQSIVPHLFEFDKTQTAPAVPEFYVPSGDASNVDWEPLKQYGRDFGNYLVSQQPNVKFWAWVAGAGAALVGFFMGAIFSRVTLILFTSALGVLMVGSGVALLARGLDIDLYQTCQDRPGISAAAVALCFAVSVGLQYVLTRPDSKPHILPAA